MLRRKDLSSDDISVITPDNAANMKKPVGLMILNFRGCYAHTLQRCVRYGIGNAGNPADDDPINTVVAVIAKCKKLVAYVNNSIKVHRKLTQAAHKHGTSNFSLKQVLLDFQFGRVVHSHLHRMVQTHWFSLSLALIVPVLTLVFSFSCRTIGHLLLHLLTATCQQRFK